MIQNERQYRVTRAAADRFARALTAFRERMGEADEDAIVAAAQSAALEAQLDDLLAQLHHYEQLRSAERTEIVLSDLGQLPEVLVSGRISAGLTQRDLADRLQVQEQQVQRYEATGYASASLTRLVEVARAIGIRFDDRVQLPKPPEVGRLLRDLRAAGFSRRFVLDRWLPAPLAAGMSPATDESPAGGPAAIRLTTVASRILQMDVMSLLANGAEIPTRAMAVGQFKLRRNVDEQDVAAYASYARYLALACLDVVEASDTSGLPADADAVRALLLAAGGVTLENLLVLCWSNGTPVLPLRDAGAFDAATWRSGGRDVIVLKQGSHSRSRWCFDLLHEYWHASRHREDRDTAVVESAQTMESGGASDGDERAANEFAGRVMLGERADEFAREAARRAGGSVERLKSITPQVAKDAGIETDSFANFLAYRLSLQGINWWGTAAGFQAGTGAWDTVRDAFLQYANFDKLDAIDRDLLVAALSSE